MGPDSVNPTFYVDDRSTDQNRAFLPKKKTKKKTKTYYTSSQIIFGAIQVIAKLYLQPFHLKAKYFTNGLTAVLLLVSLSLSRNFVNKLSTLVMQPPDGCMLNVYINKTNFRLRNEDVHMTHREVMYGYFIMLSFYHQQKT